MHLFIILFFLSFSCVVAKDIPHKDQTFSEYYKELVEGNEGKNIWFQEDGELNACGHMAFKLLKSAISHGISSQHFKKHLEIKKTSGVQAADQSLTEAILSFIHEMVGGDRRMIYAKKHPALSSSIHPQKLLKDALLSKERCQALDDFLPTHQAYLDLRESYMTYRKMLKNKKDVPEPVVTATKSMKKGDKGDYIKEVKDYLIYYGYLEDVPAVEVETKDKPAMVIFDDNLVEAVKKFQERHSLDVDGTIGPQTLNMLKLDLKTRIQKLRLNLERWRYLSYPLEDRFIIVNIPSYRVEGYDKNKKTFVTNAIVGGVTTRTPLFKAPLFQVIVNPSWGVPTSIAVRQKLSRLQEDPDYFNQAGYTFTDTTTGEQIDPTSVEWNNYSSGYFPFQMRQRPGRSNALGVIKFDLKNPYTIYMHDTNQHNLFKKNKRALSSGCVRLESPLGLATWLFEEAPYNEVETFIKLIDAHSTKHLKLKADVPVYFVYITAWVDEDGITYFSDDPYKEDEKILKNMDDSLTKVNAHPPIEDHDDITDNNEAVMA